MELTDRHLAAIRAGDWRECLECVEERVSPERELTLEEELVAIANPDAVLARHGIVAAGARGFQRDLALERLRRDG